MTTCKAYTKKLKSCKNKVEEGEEYCNMHQYSAGYPIDFLVTFYDNQDRNPFFKIITIDFSDESYYTGPYRPSVEERMMYYSQGEPLTIIDPFLRGLIFKCLGNISYMYTAQPLTEKGTRSINKPMLTVEEDWEKDVEPDFIN